jgi:quercetin dioxygenase-like cupin family protein
LVDEKSHGTPVTQFIGEIPESKAAHHRHLYEEAITVLSGEGFMWTDDTKTTIKAGDTIFLPLKQRHSLECTTRDGMRLVGLFYPSMSPAINY